MMCASAHRSDRSSNLFRPLHTYLERATSCGNEDPGHKAVAMAPNPSSPVIQPSSASTTRSSRFPWVRAVVSTLWFFGYLPAFVVLGTLGYIPSDWIIFLVLPGNLAWLIAGYSIYDLLFTIAAQRWPAAKTVREIVGPLLGALLFHHHHHP
jgi:hypothetical protein